MSKSSSKKFVWLQIIKRAILDLLSIVFGGNVGNIEGGKNDKKK